MSPAPHRLLILAPKGGCEVWVVSVALNAIKKRCWAVCEGNTKIELHKSKYNNRNTEIKIRESKYENQNTKIEIPKSKYEHRITKLESRKYENRNNSSQTNKSPGPLFRSKNAMPEYSIILVRMRTITNGKKVLWYHS